MASAQDVVSFIDTALDILAVNERLMTPELLDAVEDLFGRGGPVGDFVAAERRLTTDGRTARAIRVLNGLKNRPLILRTIARLL